MKGILVLSLNVFFVILHSHPAELLKYSRLQECSVTADDTFPEDFVIGAASSAYQVEGAWNEDGKGPSIWDKATHDDPKRIADKSNADVAADSYHKYLQDVKALNDTGVSCFISMKSQF